MFSMHNSTFFLTGVIRTCFFVSKIKHDSFCTIAKKHYICRKKNKEQ